MSGGDEIFGPNFGGATVHTNVRKGYVGECPNVGKFVSNLKFTLKMENEIMGGILNDSKDAKAAAKEWLKANPDAASAWLEGVTTFDGGDAAAASEGARQLIDEGRRTERDASCGPPAGRAGTVVRDGQVHRTHHAVQNPHRRSGERSSSIS